MVVQTSSAMAENIENYLDALDDFHRTQSRDIPEELEQLLCRIARNGEPLFPWHQLKPLVVTKLEKVIQEYVESNPNESIEVLPNVENIEFKDMRDRLFQTINSFTNAPFTIQRLCELLTEPRRYYQRSDKFMRGIEKNVQVVSTVTSGGKRITSSSSLNMQSSTCVMVNGVVADSNVNNGHHDKHIDLPEKVEHHHDASAHSSAPTDTVKMDPDSKSLEQTEETDVKSKNLEEVSKSDSGLLQEGKTDDTCESVNRTQNVDVIEGQTISLASGADKVNVVPGGLDSRTKEAGGIDTSSKTNTVKEDASVYKEKGQEQHETGSHVVKESDASDTQDVMKTEKSDSSAQESGSESKADLLQSEINAVRGNSDSETLLETPSPPGTTPVKESNHKGTVKHQEDSSQLQETSKEEPQGEETAQQETKEKDGVTMEMQEPVTQPSEESKPKVKAEEPRSEATTPQETIPQTEELLKQEGTTEKNGKESTQNTLEVVTVDVSQTNEKSSKPTSQAPEAITEESTKNTSTNGGTKESDFCRKSKDTANKCKEDDMEVDSTSSEQPRDGESGTQVTSEKSASSADTSISNNPLETTCNAEEPMDQD